MDGHGKIDSDVGLGNFVPAEYELAPYLARLKAAEGLLSFYGNPDHRAELLDTIDRVVSSHSVALLSIDVFDTALLRSTRSELGRFWSLSKRLQSTRPIASSAPESGAEDALIARIAAMRATYGMRRYAPLGGDPTLDTIAGTVCSLLNRPDLKEHYVRTELECETADVTLNPLIAEISERFPTLRTIFLSDMYLDSRQIGEILKAKSQNRSHPTIFSSADGHGSKIGGGLFDHVARTLRIEPKRALHIGDDLEHDYRAAKRCGWQALYLPLPDQELHERRLRFTETCTEIDGLDGGFGHEFRFTP